MEPEIGASVSKPARVDELNKVLLETVGRFAARGRGFSL
jgi:hypothetical protein